MLLTGSASAHADLVASSPRTGEVVAQAPGEVELRFSEGVVALDVEAGADGPTVGRPAADPNDARVWRVPLEAAAGSFQGPVALRWTAFSVDGHDTSGSVLFGVGDVTLDADTLRSGLVGVGGAEVDGREPPARAVLLTGALLCAGLPLAGWLLRSGDAARAALRWGRWAGLGMVVGAVGLVALQRPRAGSWDAYLSSRPGQVAVVRIIAGALAVLAGVSARVSGGRAGPARPSSLARLAPGVQALAGLSVAATLGWAGHSSTLRGGWVAAGIHAVHVLAAGAWVGGLILLVAIARNQPAEAGPAVARFGPLAIASVLVLTAAGITLTVWNADSPGRTLDTVWGRALAVKLVLVALALAAGARNRWMLRGRLAVEPGSARRLVERGVGVEIALVAGVVAATSLLSAARPAAGSERARDPLVVRADGLTLTLTPGAPGLNVLDVTAPGTDAWTDARVRPVPTDGTAAPDPTGLSCTALRCSSVVELGRAGEWDVRVTWFEGSEFRSAHATVELPAGPQGKGTATTTHHRHDQPHDQPHELPHDQPGPRSAQPGDRPG